eukprot:m51a1_g9242 putative sun domain-containing protein 2 (390) ;mRNA; f:131363-132882
MSVLVSAVSLAGQANYFLFGAISVADVWILSAFRRLGGDDPRIRRPVPVAVPLVVAVALAALSLLAAHPHAGPPTGAAAGAAPAAAAVSEAAQSCALPEGLVRAEAVKGLEEKVAELERKVAELASGGRASDVAKALSDSPAAVNTLAAALDPHLRASGAAAQPDMQNLRATLEALGKDLRWVTEQEAASLARREADVLKYDGRYGPDMAMASLGAVVVDSSQAYTEGLPAGAVHSAGIVLDPDVHPGNCWCFKGRAGHVTVKLPQYARVTGVSIDHIPRSLASNFQSAPRAFGVLGLGSEEEGGMGLLGFRRERERKVVLLGSFEYNASPHGVEPDPSQYFPISAENSPAQGGFSYVQLRVDSNWGHIDYTCIYRFRIHGEFVKPTRP